LQAADASPDCHLIVLEGEGGQFTAGNDLSDLIGGEQFLVMECVQGIFNTVAKLKKVLVAVVEGVAVGIGTTILLHCDMVIASSKAKFRVPFANLGGGLRVAPVPFSPMQLARKWHVKCYSPADFFLLKRLFPGA
jgi:enoyl-CoA hydratase/carnithine racemase